MNMADLQKAEETLQQIRQLEKFVNCKPGLLDRLLIVKEPRFKLGIEKLVPFSSKTITITSEKLSDAIKKALKQTIEDLKTQLVDLGIDVDEVE